MKNMVKKYFAVALIIGLLIGSILNHSYGAVEIKAASQKISQSELKKAYKNWLTKNDFDYQANDSYYVKAGIKYVDLDGNGIDEMICSAYGLRHVVLTYDQKNGTVKKLIEMWTGKGGYAYYNKNKHMVSVSNGSTGNYTTEFYKISAKKAKKRRTIETIRKEKKRGIYYDHYWKYYVDGKSVSQKKYENDLKSALKGYTQVTPKN